MGSNGLSVRENLAHMKSKPVFSENAEVRLSTCEWLPTKRQWTNDADAISAAKVRSEAAGMEIVAVRCGSCGYAHLTKKTNAHPGTILEPAPFQRIEIGEPEPGNQEARTKALSAWLEGRDAVSSAEVVEEFQVSTKTMRLDMLRLGWVPGRGRTAKWRRAVGNPVENPVEKPALALVPKGPIADKPADPVAAAVRQHPASKDAGWLPLVDVAKLGHLPLNDLLDTLAAVGVEVRIQYRRAI